MKRLKQIWSGIRFILPAGLALIMSCDHWDETSDISHESLLPEFVFTEGDFLSFVRADEKYTDPPVRAFSGEDQTEVYLIDPDAIPDSVDEPGVYIIRYYAENQEGFSRIAERIVAVTYTDVSANDLSGLYYTTLFGEEVTSRITRVNEKGLYKCEEVLGYSGAIMPGRIVDLGDNRLTLLPGEGHLGSYDISEGSYSRNSVSWTVTLLDEPNKGVAINVTWIKK